MQAQYRNWIRTAPLWCGLLLTGCKGGDDLKLHPVKGVVLNAKGEPRRGGSISFSLPEDPNFVADSKIGEDGTFDLTTYRLRDNRSAPGAPEGRYRVTINSQSTNAASDGSLPLPEEIVIAPGNNNLTIKTP